METKNHAVGYQKHRNKQKAAVATGDAKNRKALDDIGNCEITWGIENIDAVDVDNDLAMVENVEELYKQQEKLCLPKDYMSSQMEINAKMRFHAHCLYKYEEIWAPEVNDNIYVSDGAYSREQILIMEKDILNKFGCV
ncbi:hypothetical protein HPP92_007181 [Vanilla planifolia]|uniref:Cyclin N-terminal domain-containing protein n=1 Tax=Vanilla planifolia TaxID=51239 RepID=A0A835RA44_VANPL|nr:hypothetical protein HPP92_007412 [Vanilla planifolia]KAG0490318.1 hypothetical protein HPP92_007181 [Vanilla planifolia]